MSSLMDTAFKSGANVHLVVLIIITCVQTSRQREMILQWLHADAPKMSKRSNKTDRRLIIITMSFQTSTMASMVISITAEQKYVLMKATR